MNELPPGWATARIGALIAAEGIFVDGDWVESKDQDPDGDVRLIQLADIGDGTFRNRSQRFLTSSRASELRCTFLQQGDVLIARMPDPLGRACTFPAVAQRAVTAVDVCIVRPGSGGADSRWLMWAINAPQFRSSVSALQSGTTRRRISRKNLATIDLRVPPLNEQRRIVAAIEEQFSRLDAADALLGRVRSRLQILRSAVLRAAFDGSWPTSRIGDVAQVGSGATPKRGKAEYWVNGTIPWVTSGQLTEPFVNEPAAFITETALDETNVRLWPKHTLLVALYGEGKTRGHCSELLIESTTNQACAAIVLHDESVNRDYLKLFFAASYEANRQLATGGVQPNLSLGLVKNMRFPRPPSDQQQAVVDQIARELSLVQGLEDTLQTAARRSAALRRSVLERAFRGELVPQDPNDEPASALLERIAAERATAERANGHRPRPRATMQKS